MGYDIRLCIEKDIDMETVGKAIAICAGSRLSRTHGAIRVDGFRLEGEEWAMKPDGSFDRMMISFQDASGADRHCGAYTAPDADWTGSDMGVSIYPRATAFWIAVARKLVGLFGGVLDEDDSDLIETDLQVKLDDSELSKMARSMGCSRQEALCDALEKLLPLEWRDLELANERARYVTREDEKSSSWMPFLAQAESRALREQLPESSESMAKGRRSSL